MLKRQCVGEGAAKNAFSSRERVWAYVPEPWRLDDNGRMRDNNSRTEAFQEVELWKFTEYSCRSTFQSARLKP